MLPRKYKTFNKSSKEEAARLLEQSGRPAAEIARELGHPPPAGASFQNPHWLHCWFSNSVSFCLGP